MRKARTKKILITIIVVVILIAAGLGVYSIYGMSKINELAEMNFAEMLAYTTKENKEAVITVGIIQNGTMTYDVYGENGHKLAPQEYIYEIGSITKTFTTSLLCKAISEGKISLDHSIDEYLQLPDKEYYPTIKRLVTHTSGYKEFYFEKPMIGNFLQGRNDFFGITEEMLISRIGKLNLENSDYPFRYSNFGMSTVGLILEQVYNKDFTSLMNSYIADELKLKNTKISDKTGDLKNYWDWSPSDAYMPAGALLSDITDMMSYAQMQLIGKPEYLATAQTELAEVSTANETYQKMGIRMDAVGAGWMIDKENNIIWHNGATGNYNSYIGFDQNQQIGVVVLSNLAPDYRIPATVMGIEILTSLQATN